MTVLSTAHCISTMSQPLRDTDRVLQSSLGSTSPSQSSLSQETSDRHRRALPQPVRLALFVTFAVYQGGNFAMFTKRGPMGGGTIRLCVAETGVNH